MIEKIKRVQNGEYELISEIISENQQFIYSFIEKYKNIFDDYEDLKQEAICIYIYLIKRYNFNYYFSTYINTKMKQYINKYILSNIDRINNIEDRIYISKYLYNKCTVYLKHKPTIYEFNNYLRIKSIYAYQIFNYATTNSKYLSYDDSLYGEMDYNLDTVERKADSELFRDNFLKKLLTKKQAMAIIQYFGFDGKFYKLTDLGKMENTSKQTISDRVEKGKMKIKKIIKEYGGY